jgi:hypothetical protein
MSSIVWPVGFSSVLPAVPDVPVEPPLAFEDPPVALFDPDDPPEALFEPEVPLEPEDPLEPEEPPEGPA